MYTPTYDDCLGMVSGFPNKWVNEGEQTTRQNGAVVTQTTSALNVSLHLAITYNTNNQITIYKNGNVCVCVGVYCVVWDIVLYNKIKENMRTN